MKKLMTAAILSIALFSCGGSEEEAKKVDIDAKAKEMCECFKNNFDDNDKYMECEKKSNEFKESLTEKSDRTAYNKKLSDCIMEMDN